MQHKKKIRLRLILIAPTLIALVGFGVLWSFKPWIESCPRFDPVSWAFLDGGYLVVRTDDAGKMLLASFGSEQRNELWDDKYLLPDRTIFNWTPGQKHLSIASKEDWQNASGEPIMSSSFGKPSFEGRLSHSFEYDVKRYALMRNGRDVETQGRAVAATGRLSPNGRLLAVVSTDSRPIKWGLWRGFGDGWESSLWYHQVFDVATGEQISKTYALRHDTSMTVPEICWSSDSQYVVYMDYECRWIWIAPVLESPKGKEAL